MSTQAIPSTATPAPFADSGRLTDSHGRAITDLRVSVTDRCNYKCVYCRTGNDGAQYSELPLDDYLRIIRVFVALGIEKVRLTGGEPLLRRDLTTLIREIAQLRTSYGSDDSRPSACGGFRPSARGGSGQTARGHNSARGHNLDIAITTNGHLLAAQAESLRKAGLTRVTVSMDAVDPDIFARITRVPGSYDRVLEGVRAAQAIGLGPVKVNCVLLRGFNDDQIGPFVHFARAEGVILRFIEFMPLEEDRIWSPDTVIGYDELKTRIGAVRPLVPLPATTPGETAQRFTFDDGIGEIGIIAPVSRAFCGACSRVRLTSDGKIRTCLFSQMDHDLYGVLRRGGSDDDLATYIRQVIAQKEARHHIGEPGFLKPSRSMVHIGG
ncbi:MAG TPA: GTP 3',8-cyclase MoaA [Acidobacteriaceae bacterium]|nr:GTP 3',8-cyclase MoaA [Acidobacteriaceae bacterium]